MKREIRISLSAIAIEKRLAGYGAMSLAIAAAALPNANATPINWTPDSTTPVGSGIYFNVVTGSVTSVAATPAHAFLNPGSAPGSFALSNEVADPLYKAWVFGSSAGVDNKFAVSSSLNGANSSAARLARDTVVGPGLKFNNFFASLASNRAPSSALGHWNALGTDFLGLTFDIGSQTDYGWAQITINPDYTITLDSMGYDNSGAPIPAGETPEPNSLGLLALGAAGLEAYRRRRTVRQPKPEYQD